MELAYIDIKDLAPSALNVRKHGGKEGTKAGGALAESIRRLGLLQPLLVRPDGDTYAIVAGQRRYHACRTLVAEGAMEGPLPCLVMDETEDARAIEASLTENIARLPMDEIDQYKAFAALVKEGCGVTEIAERFGVTERLVRQRLAIADLHGPILTAYRKGDIDAATMRTLTMATKRQQKAWWALVQDEDAYVPMGRALRAWLFGGSQTPVANALFDFECGSACKIDPCLGVIGAQK